MLSLDGGCLCTLRCRRDIGDAVRNIIDGMCDSIHRLEGLIDDLTLLDGAARDLHDGLCCVLRTLCRLIGRGGQLLGGRRKLLRGLCRTLNQFAQSLDHRKEGVVQLPNLILTIHLGRYNAKVPFCNLGCCCRHIPEWPCDRACNHVEQTGEEGEGEEKTRNHRPFQGIHVCQHFFLRHEENE